MGGFAYGAVISLTEGEVPVGAAELRIEPVLLPK